MEKLKKMQKPMKVKKSNIYEFENPAQWLRSFKGCEHHTDEEATEIYHSLGVLAGFLLRTYPEKMYCIDNQLVVSLSDQTNENDNEKKTA